MCLVYGKFIVCPATSSRRRKTDSLHVGRTSGGRRRPRWLRISSPTCSSPTRATRSEPRYMPSSSESHSCSRGPQQLTCTSSYLELALEGPVEGEVREHLAQSHAASRSLIHVINDLLVRPILLYERIMGTNVLCRTSLALKRETTFRSKIPSSSARPSRTPSSSTVPRPLDEASCSTYSSHRLGPLRSCSATAPRLGPSSET